MARAPLVLEAKVRAKRIGLTHAVSVESRTIGAPMTYYLATENVSRTGMLLHIGKNHKVPYRLNTLIEMTVDRDAKVLPRPVKCIGKVVRVAQDSEQRPQFGIQIVQMDGQDLEDWEKAVSHLESAGRDLLPAAG